MATDPCAKRARQKKNNLVVGELTTEVGGSAARAELPNTAGPHPMVHTGTTRQMHQGEEDEESGASEDEVHLCIIHAGSRT